MVKKKMDKKQELSNKKFGYIVGGILLGIVVIVIISMQFSRSENGVYNNMNTGVSNSHSAPSEKSIELERYAFDIRSWRITPTYIELRIKNIGENDYEIGEVNIENCGVGGGSILEKNEEDKFTVLCSHKFTEGQPFSEKITIKYSLVGRSYGDTGEWTNVISGNVLEKKCFYDVSGEVAPVSMGNCQSKLDCIKGVSHLIDLMNKNREINNQPQITSNDVGVIDCSYA